MNHRDKNATSFLLTILFIAAVVTLLLALLVKPKGIPSADVSPAMFWNAEEQCQMYRHWCDKWPNCGPCVNGKPIEIQGWLEAELARPANDRKF